MKNRKFLIIFLFIVSMMACKKESNRQASNLFAGKVKTITDNSIPYGLDSIYLFYDSTTGILKDVLIRRINTFLSDSDTYHMTIRHDNNVINIKVYFNDDTTGIHYKITTINKQITSILNVNSLDNTETLDRQVYINANHVDSTFDIGMGTGGYLSDIHTKDFVYTNNNCTYYTSKWTKLFNPVAPVYGIVYDTLHFYYNSHINTQMLLYQQPLEKNISKDGNINMYWFILDLLQTDGYYILSHNNNLLDSFVTSNSIVNKYAYEFNADNKISVVRINSKLNTIESNTEQHMTYY